jgi:hypothetical protein
MVLLFGLNTANAKQCSEAVPSNPQGHWSFRLIDGRKCWYEGENNFPKSLLQWPEQNSALSPRRAQRELNPARSGTMAEVTYYVALPFVAADDGIAAGEPTIQSTR